jgi:hypothetical protein
MNNLRERLINGGVRNLKAYGYPSVSKENILTDEIYREFFRSMLRDNKGSSKTMDVAIDGLLAEIGPRQP